MPAKWLTLKYNNVISTAQIHNADTVLIEVAESDEYDAVFCLELCTRLRDNSPGCRRVLLCPEQDELCVIAAVESERDGLIDDFTFYDGSIGYLASKLLSTYHYVS